MEWFLIALLAPLFWSIGNHSDKYQLNTYLKGESVGSLIIYTALFSFFVLPVALFFSDGDVFALQHRGMIVLAFSGILEIVGVFFYLYALLEEDVSTVVPFFQLIPVFSYLFGYLFLGETLSSIQTIAGLVILIGASVLSFEIEEDNSLTFKLAPTLAMVASTAVFALSDTFFKTESILPDGDFWVSAFWKYIGGFIIGAVLFLGVSRYRREFIGLLGVGGARIICLNIFSEGTSIVGYLILNFATLSAPLALVSLATAFQPLFVLVIGLIIALIAPKFSQENFTKRHLAQKTGAIAVMLLGSYFLFV